MQENDVIMTSQRLKNIFKAKLVIFFNFKPISHGIGWVKNKLKFYKSLFYQKMMKNWPELVKKGKNCAIMTS